MKSLIIMSGASIEILWNRWKSKCWYWRFIKRLFCYTFPIRIFYDQISIERGVVARNIPMNLFLQIKPKEQWSKSFARNLIVNKIQVTVLTICKGETRVNASNNDIQFHDILSFTRNEVSKRAL